MDALAAIEEGGSFTISNTGEGVLVVSDIYVENNSCWLEVPEPHSFSIEPGDSRLVLVNINHSCVPSGLYQDTILINSNDPDETPIDVPVGYGYPANGNDIFVFAKDVTAISYQDAVSTINATSDSTDPELPVECNINESGEATVWYKYRPLDDGALSINTKESDYDTFLAIWEGTSLDGFRFVACNNDTSETKQSSVAFRIRGGLTYYIEVGQP